jgi:hypothetical protein
MPPISKEKKLAEELAVSTDEIIGTLKPTKKQIEEEKISHSLMKRIRIVEKLPVRDQKVVFTLINSRAQKNKLKPAIPRRLSYGRRAR